MAEIGKKLGKLSLAILKSFVEGQLGKRFVDELRAPTDKALAIQTALERAENRFIREYEDKDLSQAIFVDMPVDQLKLGEVVTNFYNDPTNPALPENLESVLMSEFKFLSRERIGSAIDFYIQLLIEELAIVDESFREKLGKTSSIRKSANKVEVVPDKLTSQTTTTTPEQDVISSPKRQLRSGVSSIKKAVTAKRQRGEVLNYLEIDRTPKTDSDRPSGPDRLNYSRYAEAFARIVLNHETSTPLTIGIYGSWGKGKSFLMGKIKDALKNSNKTESSMSVSAFQHWQNQNSVDGFIDPLLYFTNVLSISVIELCQNIGAFFLSPIIWLNENRRRRREKVDIHIVEFNAWAYVGTDHLWAGLVTHLYREIEKYFGLRVTLARLGRVVNKSLPKSIPIFLLYGLLGLGASLLLNYNESIKGWEELTVALKAFVGTVLGGTALAGLPVLLTTLKEFLDNLFLTRSKNLQNLAARPDFKAQIGIMADIKDEIRFMGRLLRKGKQGHLTRFILFIDDLDRCENKKAVEVMQALMLLITDDDGAPFVIFMGIDARVIVHAIEETYGEVLVKAGINGYEYLDKIVQIPFVIPDATDVDIQNYVRSMLWDEKEEALIRSKSRVEEQEDATQQQQSENKVSRKKRREPPTLPPIDLEKIPVSFTRVEHSELIECTKEMISNPRKIKRIINIYRLARLILPTTINRTTAIHWFILTEQWPLHIAWIVELIATDNQKNKPELRGRSLRSIYLNRARRNIYSENMQGLLGIDDDPDKFRTFIRKYDLSVSEIEELWRYTFNLNPAIISNVSKEAVRLDAERAKKRAPVLPKESVERVSSAKRSKSSKARESARK